MAWDVDLDEHVFDWLVSLDEKSFIQVRAAINLPPRTRAAARATLG